MREGSFRAQSSLGGRQSAPKLAGSIQRGCGDERDPDGCQSVEIPNVRVGRLHPRLADPEHCHPAPVGSPSRSQISAPPIHVEALRAGCR